MYQEKGSNGRYSVASHYGKRRSQNAGATYRVAVTTGSKKNAGTDARVRAPLIQLLKRGLGFHSLRFYTNLHIGSILGKDNTFLLTARS